MASETRKQATPPYIALPTFLSFIKGLGEAGVPSRIDKSLLRNMSGSNQSALLSALKWFNLIDDAGAHGQRLETLAKAGDKMGAVLGGMLPEAYAFMADGTIDLTRATGAQLEEKFKAYGLTGETVVKAMSFFLAACKEAGIAVSSHIKLPKVVRSGGAKAKKGAKPVTDAGDEGNGGGGAGGGAGGEVGLDLDPLLIALLQKIPPQGQPWPQDRRLRWFKTFAMNVSQVYDDDDDSPVELSIAAQGVGNSGGAS